MHEHLHPRQPAGTDAGLDATAVLPLTELPGLPRLVRRQRRLAAGAGALAASLLVFGCAAGTFGSRSASSAPAVTADPPSFEPGWSPPGDVVPGSAEPGDDGSGAAGTAGTDTDADDTASDATEDALAVDDDSHGFGDGGQAQQPPTETGDDDGPVELDPVGPAAVHPCDALPGGASLLVLPDPIVLPADEMSGALSITNCSEGDVDWTAATKPGVDLTSAGANLLPGETTGLGFTIDLADWAPGAIEFKIKVSGPGHNRYVDVSAYDTLFGSESGAGEGALTAGAGAGGCGNQCITSAWLTPNLTSPNVTLDLRTNTPATLRVWVSETAPTLVDGVPTVPVTPIVVSEFGLEALTTVLQPLDPATEYHVIVSATDADGDVAHRWSSFTTITPATRPGGFASPAGPAGCSVQCITSAVITPGPAEGTRHLAVISHTDARFQVFVGPDAPVADGDGGFDMPETTFWANSGEQYSDSWDVVLDSLPPSTVLHVLVTAVDAQGRASYQAGQFQTPAAPLHGTLVMLHRVEVTYDGDAGINRGEVSFRWGFDDLVVGSWGERKVNDGDVIAPDSHNAWALWGVGDFKPTVYVNTAERDADGLVEFCSAGTGVRTEPGHHDGCDLSYNVASTGIVSDVTIAAMPRCNDLGIDTVGPEARCTWIESTVGDGYDTEFRALVSYENF